MFSFVAHPSNTDTVWIGNDGAASPDVTNANGYPLLAGGSAVVLLINNLNEIWFDSAVNGEKICWVKLD
jgi:hypothetical protein